MKLNIDVRFSEKDKYIKCVIKLDGKDFVNTRKVENQADRINAKKRAKQLAYLGAMCKVHGYVCEKKLKVGEDNGNT